MVWYMYRPFHSNFISSLKVCISNCKSHRKNINRRYDRISEMVWAWGVIKGGTKTATLSGLHCCILVNCGKTLTKSNSRNDRVNFTPQVLVIVHPLEKSEQKLRIASQRLGAESGTVKEHCSVACSAPLSSLVFLYNPGLPA